MTDRREFLKGAGFLSLAAAAGGCQFMRMGFGDGAPMADFAVPALKRVRVAFVGVGDRGTAAFRRISQFPGVDAVAVCDLEGKKLKACQEFLKTKGLPPAKEYLGPEAYRALCAECDCDVVYACTPWKLHAPVALEAMRCGKHALVEVPATMDVESCWELVETSERTRRHCMMLENCCYGEFEMLCHNMCRLGVLGEPVYGEAGYLHSGSTFGTLSKFRAEWYMEHRGNYYPTHGLGPVALCLDVNRGDRFDYLNSMEGMPLGELAAKGDPRWAGKNIEYYKKYRIGPHNSSLIRTVNGKMIFLDLSCQVPHPYSRINTVQGTHGIFMDYPLRIDVEDKPGAGPHSHKVDPNVRFDPARTQKLREQYKHPLWKQVGELAKKVGGHGGMDFIMDLRWVYCLQNGLPLDMNVYDLASWSCLCEVTERSQSKRGASEDIPDFTRGAWKSMKPVAIGSIDLRKMKFREFTDGRQQNV